MCTGSLGELRRGAETGDHGLVRVHTVYTPHTPTDPGSTGSFYRLEVVPGGDFTEKTLGQSPSRGTIRSAMKW